MLNDIRYFLFFFFLNLLPNYFFEITLGRVEIDHYACLVLRIIVIC